MYIESVPNRNSPPAVLLRESYRENGKVRKRTLCNLSDWPAAHVEGLRGVLKGGTVIAPDREAFTVVRSLPHGHIAAAIGIARKIGLDRILGPDGNRCRDLVLAMIAARILDPGSKLATARALAPAIRDLLNSGALQLSLFDERDMASISSPDYPGERLIVCRNADLAAERTRKRQDLLAATERELGRIQAAVARKRAPLRGTAEIPLAVGAVGGRYNMRTAFDLT